MYKGIVLSIALGILCVFFLLTIRSNVFPSFISSHAATTREREELPQQQAAIKRDLRSLAILAPTVTPTPPPMTSSTASQEPPLESGAQQLQAEDSPEEVDARVAADATTTAVAAEYLAKLTTAPTPTLAAQSIDPIAPKNSTKNVSANFAQDSDTPLMAPSSPATEANELPTGIEAGSISENVAHSAVSAAVWPAGCEITHPPGALGLDPFYTKYCAAQGLSIVAAAGTSDPALQRAWEIVNHMLDGMAQAEEIRASLARLHLRIGIIGATQFATDMPEHRNLYTYFPNVDWNNRTRAIGATQQIPLLSIAEDNLLCHSNNIWPGQNMLVHEFAHAIKNLGLDVVDPSFHTELERIYQHARQAGLWGDTYIVSDVEEYWAEGVRIYFQTVPVSGQSYPANTRAELQAYDPELYQMVARIFGSRPGLAACP